MFIDQLWGSKVNNIWNYWATKVTSYLSACRRKLRSVSAGGVIPHRYRRVFATLDGTRFRICRPLGNGNQQAGAYNTYYGFHNIGFQGITAPDGMILQLSGPHAGSDNDLNMLADSGSLHQIRDALQATGMQHMQVDLVADKIYNIAADGLASIRLNPVGEEEVAEDTAASKIRIPVEWSFGKIKLHFPFINTLLAMKINQRAVGKYVRVCALMTNIHTCLYGCESSVYFSSEGHLVLPPNLEEYMSTD